MASRVIVELAEHIKARCNVYSSALQADLTNLRRTHGAEPVREALGMLDELRAVASWDSEAHRREVQHAIDRLLMRKAEDPENFRPDGPTV
jgi:hypothetical protein